MFRSIPDSAGPRQQTTDPGVYELGLLLRRRLFYIGLLSGHTQSALCLWWSFSYSTPAGKAEKEMILRCLESVTHVSPKVNTLVEAVKADAADDIKRARKHLDTLEINDFPEYDLLWKRRAEFLYAVDQEKALAWIWAGRDLFPAPVIVAILEQFKSFTKDEYMKLRISLYLSCYSSNYTFNLIAKQYETLGNKLMAREYYELGGATGDKASQAWMVQYIQDEMRNSWLKRRTHVRQLESWKSMLAK